MILAQLYDPGERDRVQIELRGVLLEQEEGKGLTLTVEGGKRLDKIYV